MKELLNVESLNQNLSLIAEAAADGTYVSKDENGGKRFIFHSV